MSFSFTVSVLIWLKKLIVSGDVFAHLELTISFNSAVSQEVTDLKITLEKCEAELENNRKANESSLLPLSMLPAGSHVEELYVPCPI